MPGRNKQPIDLLQAKGKKHLTKAEIEERKAMEIKVPFTDINPPAYLATKARKDKFVRIAGMLDEIGIWSELDEDTLAMFVIAQDQYQKLTKSLEKAMKEKAPNWRYINSIHSEQNTAFKQAMACASKLGLTITDRCRLVAPKTEDSKPANRFADLMGGFDA